VEFPPSYGRAGVYWFDMPETFSTLSGRNGFQSARFQIYNHLTWIAATGFPSDWMQQAQLSFSHVTIS